MLYVVIDDCSVEIDIKRKGSGMTIHSYNINIVGFGEFEVVGQREFSHLYQIIENEIQKAMMAIDSNTNWMED